MRKFIIVSIVIALIAPFASCVDSNELVPGDDYTPPSDTVPSEVNSLTIEEFGDFKFDPTRVETVRPDLFNPGYMSLFDLLVYLSDRGDVELTYHFDEEMDTHVIDDLNGFDDWWYEVWYDGGWREISVHRMDYYPVKDKMHIEFYRESEGAIQKRFTIWKKEVRRRAENGGKVIIPEVTIRKDDDVLVFENVEVTPHGIRSDMFVEGTVTAVDIIMSLGDRGEIEYKLEWYEHIGQVEVKDYFVEEINGYDHSGKCGFVYEVGEDETQAGNHIHVMTDIRVLHSPNYALFFWIELGSCEE
ncbi:MAG: hypothetical protein GY771_07390 [bacterium]|nr:hypothetical protein [bacterium]